MKVLTFSRYFPAYHPKKGEPTFFVEQICRNIHAWTTEGKNICNLDEWAKGREKSHTIRAGNRWNVGDCFSPRVWSEKPYRSKQIEFASPIEVKKVFGFEIKENSVFVNNEEMPADMVGILAGNDGLSFVDMMHWFKFPKPFTGQIICWNESIEY